MVCGNLFTLREQIHFVDCEWKAVNQRFTWLKDAFMA